MRFYIICVYLFMIFCNAKELDSVYAQTMIQKYEPFFREALVQGYEHFKIRKDSQSGLSYIDFCMYPPDRSLPFGALDNGRFRGEQIQDLPFPCDKSSGAKKYFIHNATIESSYKIIRSLSIAKFLADTIPSNNTITTHLYATITTLWQIDNNRKRLWIFYRNDTLLQSCTLIFTQKGKHTEVIVQYLNMD